MSERTEQDFLSDMQEALHRIAGYTVGMTYKTFLSDKRTQDAVIRNLEILGEATKHIAEPTRLTYDHIPWKNMAGARDRLIHNYFGVNLDIVWQIVTAELPQVAIDLAQVVSDLTAKED
ncbi:MAG: DUF86 domain-containing protein [Chloroflexi bacterium]|nr:DUF86 domain-containing protein [Chloroflexota bacterium]